MNAVCDYYMKSRMGVVAYTPGHVMFGGNSIGKVDT